MKAPLYLIPLFSGFFMIPTSQLPNIQKYLTVENVEQLAEMAHKYEIPALNKDIGVQSLDMWFLNDRISLKLMSL
jgi:hypothetical protein